MVQLKVFTFNPIQVNAYIIYETGGEGILIDPSCLEQKEFDTLRDFISIHGIRLEYLLNTHGHFDHVFGAGMVKAAYHPKYLIHRDDAVLLRMAGDQARSLGFDYEGIVPEPDGFLNDSDLISAGEIRLTVLHVPGHSRGGLAFYEATSGWLFTGDTLFAGAVGRTDLPGGDFRQLITSIRERLMVLPDETKVFPGHGPASTIKKERLTNPFL